MRLKTGKSGKGFTLIEMLVVLGLMAMLAAVVVPNLVGYLGRGEEQAYNADKKAIQVAVDAYYADNANQVKGKKSFPILGKGMTGSGNDDGWYGGTPVWDEKSSPANTSRDVGEDWKTVGGIDTESYFIKFSLLTEGKYLTSAPATASKDNDATYTGSYGWYVDANGKVESAYYYELKDTAGAVKTGFQPGVYP